MVLTLGGVSTSAAPPGCFPQNHQPISMLWDAGVLPIVMGFTNDFVNVMAMGLTSPRQRLVKLAVVPDNQIAPMMDQGIN